MFLQMLMRRRGKPGSHHAHRQKHRAQAHNAYFARRLAQLKRERAMKNTSLIAIAAAALALARPVAAHAAAPFIPSDYVPAAIIMPSVISPSGMAQIEICNRSMLRLELDVVPYAADLGGDGDSLFYGQQPPILPATLTIPNCGAWDAAPGFYDVWLVAIDAPTDTLDEEVTVFVQDGRSTEVDYRLIPRT